MFGLEVKLHDAVRPNATRLGEIGRGSSEGCYAGSSY